MLEMSDETGWRISCLPQHQTFQEAPEALAQNHSWLALSPQDAPIFKNIMKTSLRRLTSPAFPRPPSLWRFSANDHWTFLCTSSVGQSVQSNVKTGIVMYMKYQRKKGAFTSSMTTRPALLMWELLRQSKATFSKSSTITVYRPT